MQKLRLSERDRRISLINKIVKKAGLPPGKSSKGYLTREQLQNLYMWMLQQSETVSNLTHQVEEMAERVLTDGKPIQTPESESI